MYGQVSQRTILFDGMYIADQLGFILKLAGYLFVAFGLLYSRDYLEERGILRGADEFEFDILEMLMRSAGRVLSRDALMENFYNRKATPFDRRASWAEIAADFVRERA